MSGLEFVPFYSAVYAQPKVFPDAEKCWAVELPAYKFLWNPKSTHSSSVLAYDNWNEWVCSLEKVTRRLQKAGLTLHGPSQEHLRLTLDNPWPCNRHICLVTSWKSSWPTDTLIQLKTAHCDKEGKKQQSTFFISLVFLMEFQIA